MGKLCRRWTGPYEVVKVFRNKCVRVRTLSGSSEKSVSLERVKECPESWAKTIRTHGRKDAKRLLDVGPWQGALGLEGQVVEVIDKRTLSLEEDYPVVQYQVVWMQDGRRTTEWVDMGDIVEADLIYEYEQLLKENLKPNPSAGADRPLVRRGESAGQGSADG